MDHLPSRRGPLRTGVSAADRERAAALHLASLPQYAIWLWTDGSAKGGFSKGGDGAVIVWPDEETEELRAPAGQLCSSYRVEMAALVTGLEARQTRPKDRVLPIIIFTDSLSVLATLRTGPATQTPPLGVAACNSMSDLSKNGWPSRSLRTVAWRAATERTESLGSLQDRRSRRSRWTPER